MFVDVKSHVAILLALAFAIAEVVEGTDINNGDDRYPIFDITTYIQGIFRQNNDAEPKEILRKTLKEELSPTLYYIADPNFTVFKTFNETFVRVSKLIAEIDVSNSVKLKRKIILVLKQYQYNLLGEAHWANDNFSEKVSQILKTSIASIIFERDTDWSCDLVKHVPDMKEQLQIIRKIQEITNVPVGLGYTFKKPCESITLTVEGYFPADIVVKTVNFTAEVGFLDSYYFFSDQLKYILNQNPTTFGDKPKEFNPNVTLRVSLSPYVDGYNDEFRLYQALLKQFVIRWQAETGSRVIFNMINEYSPESMLPFRNELQDSWENVSSTIIPFLFMKELLPTVSEQHNCLNVRLGQIASKFDSVILDFDAWRYIVFQRSRLQNSKLHPYTTACNESDLENYDLKIPSNVFLFVNMKRCEGSSCNTLGQVFTTLQNNTQLRGMTVKGVMFSFAVEDEDRQVEWNVLKLHPNFKNISLGCVLKYGNLKSYYSRKSFKKCALKIQPGIASVSIWEFHLDLNDSPEDNYEDAQDFYTKAIQSPLYKIKEDMRKLDPGQEVILAVAARPTRKRFSSETQLFCDEEVKLINMLQEQIINWARIHKIKVILKPAFETATGVGWWSRLSKYTGYELVARNYPPKSNFGNDPCLDFKETLSEKVIFDCNRTGITIDMSLRKQIGSNSLNVDELKMLTTLALHVSPTIEFRPRIRNVDRFTADLETITDMISDSNFDSTLALNNITSGRFFVDMDAHVLSQSRKVIQRFLRACRNGNSSKLKIGGIHISWSSSINPNHFLDILENIRETTDLGVAFDSCYERPGIHNPTPITLFENTTYLMFTDQYTHTTDTREEEQVFLQAWLDGMLSCQRRTLKHFPELQRIFFRQKLTFDHVGERSTLSVDVAHYLKRQFSANLYAKAYNISNFVLGFDSTTFDSRYSENTWWKISNHSDLANSSVFTEKRSFYFNEQSWKPYSDEESESSERDKESTSWIVVISCGVSVCIFLALLFTMYHLRQSRRNLRFLTRKEMMEFYDGISLNNYNGPESPSELGFLSQKFSKSYEIPKSELKSDGCKILGTGNFGMVYEGEVRGSSVAVKVPHDNCSKETFRSMLFEVKILAYLGTHPNLIEFVGCCTKEIENGMIYIATGLCELGSLQNYLRMDVPPIDGSIIMGGNVRLDELLRYSAEIASGMEYISKKHVVHGDLATRNVLLDRNVTCKIGDFGLSRKLYEYAEYVKTSQEPLPWRWMAYESLTKMEFTSKSDVWSFGVTLWEIFSLGAIPYPGLAWTTNFAEDLKKGLRMESPENASEDVYRQMRSCWNLESDARPDFSELREFFLQLRNQLIYTEL